MTTVRSQRLLAYTATAAALNSPVFASPDGFTTLVKSVVAWNHAGVDRAVRIILGTSSGVVNVLWQPVVPNNTVLEHETWLVLNPGDYIYASSDGPDATVWISGSVLTGAPTLPPAFLSVAALERILTGPDVVPQSLYELQALPPS